MDHPRQPPAPPTKIATETPIEDAFSVLVTDSAFGVDGLATTVRGDELSSTASEAATGHAPTGRAPTAPDPASSIAPTLRAAAGAAPTLMSVDAASGELALTRGASQVALLDDATLVGRAGMGHSPSVRTLVNLSDTVVALASTAKPATVGLAGGVGSAAPDPLAATDAAAASEAVLSRVASSRMVSSARVPSSLASRIIASAGQTLRSVGAAPPEGDAGAANVRTKARTFRPANETAGLLHRGSPGEPERLARVHELKAAGGPTEGATNRALAQLLAQLGPFFDFEIVLVSAVTADRTVHRVNRGLPADGSLDEVPRELSFCTHTVSSDEPLVVEDAAAEAFFRSSALVRDLGARSYLGLPLRSGALVLGSLCAISRHPHRIRPEDVAMMGHFSSVAQALVNHDEAALRALVLEPTPWPEQTVPQAGAPISGATPLLYAAPHFDALLGAQRARGAAGFTLVRMPRATWRGALHRLPGSALCGVAPDATAGTDGVAMLVPPAHERLVEVAQALSAELPGVVTSAL